MTRFMNAGLLLTLVTTGCGSSSNTAAPGGAGSPDSGATKEAVRSSCGDMPILDDAWKNTSDECKACVDNDCCTEAQACADNPDCKGLWECRAKCDSLVSSCVDACNAAVTPLPPENAALLTCRNRCKPCLDLESCRQSAPPAPSKASYPVEITCLSYTSSQVVFAGLTVKVCEPTDNECKTPVSSGVTDANGVVKLDIPSSPWFSDAYLEITGPNVEPTRNYLRSPVGRAIFDRGTLTQRLLDSATASAFAGILGAKSDPATTGLAAIIALSCGGVGVAGMTISSSGADAATITGYVDGVAPSPTTKMTDPSGLGGFADHPPGPTTFTVSDAATGATMGSADVYIRAGFFTTISVTPSP